jgi:hypothetical protein
MTAWFAIVEKESMKSGRGRSKGSRITTNILTISNALDAKKFTIYNLHLGPYFTEEENNQKGGKT